MDSGEATLKRENELTDLSKIPSSEIPANPSILGRISEQGHHLLDKVSGTLSHGIGSLKGLVSHNKEEVEQKAEEKITEVKEAVNEWEQPLKKIEKKAETEPAAPTKPAENIQASEPIQESQGIREKIREGISGLTSQISNQYDNLKERFAGSKEEAGQDQGEGSQSLTGKIKDGFQMIQSKISSKKENEGEEGGFHVVTEGFRETVDELKKEQAGDQNYVSSNPFEGLERTPSTDESQRSLGQDLSNRAQQLREGIANTADKISSKIRGALHSQPLDVENTQTA